MRKTLSGVLAAAALAVFLIPALAAGMGGRAAAAEGAPAILYTAAATEASPPDTSSGNDTETDTVKPPRSGTGWAKDSAGNDYFFKNGRMMKDYWVLDASAHDLWYHVGADGKLTTGFQYVVDKTQPDGWYMFQSTDYNGMRGAMLTGWQQTGSSGWGWFNPSHNGYYGECTYTDAWGDYHRSAGVWSDGRTHR